MIWEPPSSSSGGDGFSRGDEKLEDGEGEEGDEEGLVEVGEGRLRQEALGDIAAAAPTPPGENPIARSLNLTLSLSPPR